MKYILILIIPFILGCGINKTVTVPIESSSEEYTSKIENNEIYIKDSIFIRDSIFVKEANDTVFYYRTIVQEQLKYRDKLVEKIDTFIKVDTIEVPVPVTETVEINTLYWWQKALILLGGVFLLLVIFLVSNKFK